MSIDEIRIYIRFMVQHSAIPFVHEREYFAALR